MKFNVNNNVRVQLTDYGRLLHQRYYAKFLGPHQYKAPEEDVDGWSTWQLWRLMQVFGFYMVMGSEEPFKTEIEIPENQ